LPQIEPLEDLQCPITDNEGIRGERCGTDAVGELRGLSKLDPVEAGRETAERVVLDFVRNGRVDVICLWEDMADHLRIGGFVYPAITLGDRIALERRLLISFPLLRDLLKYADLLPPGALGGGPHLR